MSAQIHSSTSRNNTYRALCGIHGDLGLAVAALHKVGVARALHGQNVPKVSLNLCEAVGARTLHT